MKWNSKVDEKAVRLYEKGQTMLQIADVIGMSQSSVLRRFQKLGVPRRKQGVDIKWLQKSNKQKIVTLYKSGQSMLVIAKQLGAHKRTIKKILVEEGVELRTISQNTSGSKNPSWKGGRKVDVDGYILVYSPQHPYRSSSNTVREHRLVMEQMIGRYLLPSEVVDHINGITSDNRPENLRLFSNNSEHLKATLTGRIPKWTEDGLARLMKTVPSAWKVHYMNCPKKTCVHRSQIAKNRPQK